PALGNALPNVALASAAAAQMELRRQTAGFTLLSAKEVQPGVLVFRLRDETPSATEAPGPPQGRPNPPPRPERELHPPRYSPPPPRLHHRGRSCCTAMSREWPPVKSIGLWST